MEFHVSVSFPQKGITQFRPVNLIGKTCIAERDGGEHGIWRKNSGQDGVKNICSSYKQETSGFGHKKFQDWRSCPVEREAVA